MTIENSAFLQKKNGVKAEKSSMAVVDEDIDWQLIKNLVFGGGITENVFERWLQPFQFFKVYFKF